MYEDNNMTDPISPWADLITIIVKRFDSYISKISDRKEQNAARILKSANVIKVLLNALDEFFRDNMLPLRSFDPNCSREERENLKMAIIRFSEREKIRPLLIEYYGELDGDRKTSNGKYILWVGDLLDNTKIIIDYLGNELQSILTGKELEEILNMINNANTQDDSIRLKDKAEELLNSFDRIVLFNVYSIFGRLTQEILSKYPYIPHPVHID